MCPDRQILSAYFDDEVPSPWKEKLTLHVAECRECAKVLESYGLVRTSLRADEAPVGESAVRVKESLRLYRPAPLWRRKIRFSFAAAAALAAFILGGGVSFTAISLLGNDDRVAEQSVKPFDVTVKVKDVKQLLEILNNQKSIREVTIQLPEKKHFEIRGEPIFLKAADYSGGSR